MAVLPSPARASAALAFATILMLQACTEPAAPTARTIANIPQQTFIPACVQAPPGMIAWWRGENSTSEEAGARNGTFSGATAYATGMVGQAFSLTGGNGVNVPLDALWSWNTTKFTIELWAKFNSVPGVAPFMAQDLGGGSQYKWIFMEESSNLRFHINGPGLGALYPANTPWSVTVGSWYHIALTRNGDEYKLYVDGVNVSTSTDAHTVPEATNTLTIGEAEGFHFVGALDEITMYNTALRPSQIAAIHAAGSDGKCTNTTLTAASNGTYTSDENTAVPFSAAGTSSTAGVRKYRWSFGDGAVSGLESPSHKYADNGTYDVKLIVMDSAGVTAGSNTTATISNVAPTATFSAPAIVAESASYTLQFKKPVDGVLDKASLVYEFDCGDGLYGAFSASTSRTCPGKAESPSVVVRGMVRDKDAAMTEYIDTLVIRNLKPVVTLAATTATTLVVGDTLRVHGTFADTNGDGPWQVAFVWGNGATSSAMPTQGSADSERVYSVAGVYNVFLKVTDKDGAAGKSAVIVVTVTN